MRAITGVLVALSLVAPSLASPARAEREAPCERARRYRGPSIDLDVKDADLHNVFRFLADAGGVNIVVPDDVHGAITLRLKRVPWEQALCTVVRVEKLELSKEGSIYSVTTRER
jgi:type IV pilus assembly protein PilQ